MSQETINELFEKCVRLQGTAYLQAEGALVAQGDAALEFLQTQQETSPDQFVRLLASVLAQSIQGNASLFQQALTYMDAHEAKNEGTQVVTPRSDSIAADLYHLFGKNVASFLAVRLAKEPEWPQWKVASVTHYLSLANEPEALPALARFEAENKKPHYAHLIELARQPSDPASMERTKLVDPTEDRRNRR